jgi:peptide/nickel transport system substrate-binding protein
MSKRLAVMAIALLLALSQPAALAQTAAEEKTITIATATQLSGHFFSEMWGNNAVDADIRNMLHGYATVAMNYDGEYQIDETVVKDLAVSDDIGGGRTYTITLSEEMTYNNGARITAEDYLFSILLQSDPVIPLLGGTQVTYAHVAGFGEYEKGESEVFSGLRLLEEYKFSVAIPADALPYYYEMAYIQVTPFPISVIAPGYRVRDDGEGAYLAMENRGVYTSAPLTKELLDLTLLAENGYMRRPGVTSGPYQLEEYDAANSSVTVKINPAYRGNYDGRKPIIARVKVIQLLDDQGIAAFENGSVDIVHRLSGGAAIDQAVELSGAGRGNLSGYLRSGYAFLAFACEQYPLDDVNVRKAITLCVDRDTICGGLMNGYALPVNGYYGWGQWMAVQSVDELNANSDVGYNINEARRLLEGAGFTLNSNGETYRSGRDDFRYKKGEDGELLPLELKWAKTPGSVPDKL